MKVSVDESKMPIDVWSLVVRIWIKEDANEGEYPK